MTLANCEKPMILLNSKKSLAHKMSSDIADVPLIRAISTFFLLSDVPAYLGEHRVIPAGWNYPDVDDYPVFETEEDVDLEYVIDLREGPPSYETVLENKDK